MSDIDVENHKQHIAIPLPLVRPFGTQITAGAVQDVWDAYVKPDQDSGNPPSVEMRCLMAILRAVYAGMVEKERLASDAPTPPPLRDCPCG